MLNNDLLTVVGALIGSSGRNSYTTTCLVLVTLILQFSH